MKNFQTSIKYVLYLFLCVVTLSSCGEYGRLDNLILTDCKTGKTYKIIHYRGYHYKIEMEVVKISGSDTTTVFEEM